MMRVEIDGVARIQYQLQQLGDRADSVLAKVIADAAKNIESIAKKRLAGMLGSAKHWIHGSAGLAGSVQRREVTKGKYGQDVYSDKHYAPYIEFGTGSKVFQNYDFSDEAKSYAAQFKGSGRRRVNIRGDSYLYFAACEEEKVIMDRVEKEINKLL